MFLPGCATMPAAAPVAAAPSSAQAGTTTIVAVAAPATPQMTLPAFLGLKGLAQGIGGIGSRIRNRLGSRFPFLEAKPPLLALTDPANKSENASPAVKAAAEAKAEEDAAPQKAKAIRYLASLGCGKCYPDTEAALLAALDDCNEQIRLETLKGLRKSMGEACRCCQQNSCCSPKLLKKLTQLGYEVNDSGCFFEPSASVRRLARLVASECVCSGAMGAEPAMLPKEGPPGEAVPSEAPPTPQPNPAGELPAPAPALATTAFLPPP
jgi:hypothetical protein